MFVVPSRPGIPIAINGCDASWSVVEGDIGLARPGHLTPVIVGGGRPLPPRWSYHRHPYYPRYGSAPMRGRYEIDPGPDRPMPEPAESYLPLLVDVFGTADVASARYGETPRPRQQSYQADSEQLPATIDDRAAAVPAADRRRAAPGPPAIDIRPRGHRG